MSVELLKEAKRWLLEAARNTGDKGFAAASVPESRSRSLGKPSRFLPTSVRQACVRIRIAFLQRHPNLNFWGPILPTGSLHHRKEAHRQVCGYCGRILPSTKGPSRVRFSVVTTETLAYGRLYNKGATA
jgi:hypothetical protein